MKKYFLKIGFLLFLILTVASGFTAYTVSDAKYQGERLVVGPGTCTNCESKAEVSLPTSTLNDPEQVTKAQVQKDYGNLPLYFIQNDGQMSERVKFYERGNGHTTFFTKEGIYLSLVRSQPPESSVELKSDTRSKKRETEGFKSKIPNPEIQNHQSAFIKLALLNASKEPEIVAEELQAGKVNYFIGNDPEKWRTDIPTYRVVIYKEIYKNIDIKFYGNNRQFEYDIIVKPGADPKTVKFSYEGIEGLRVTEEGDLEIVLKQDELIQKKPYIYQEIDGKKVEVEGKFVLNSQSSFVYSFDVASYNKDYLLIIDPILEYSTYLGGSNTEGARAIAVDSSGNAYITGGTSSDDFPTVNPFQGSFTGGNGGDVFVTKFDPTGSALVYSTYIGGYSYEWGDGIAVDGTGNAYVAGRTGSTDYPTTPSAFQGNAGGEDVFITKLSSSGSALDYSTYLGGSGHETAYAIAVDGSGSAYVTGYTYSFDFPTVNPVQGTKSGNSCVFITKLDPSGSALSYSTYLGGSIGGYGHAIAVDGSGSAYVAGFTWSTDFPTTPSAFQESFAGGQIDATVTKLNSSGSGLVYSTYLGGNSNDDVSGIAVDNSGNAYITGVTLSANFPTTPGAFQESFGGGFNDGFVTKLNSSGSGLVYSTYLGGNSNDSGDAIAVDNSGNAYITGTTRSTDFPTAFPIQESIAGNVDNFITKLNSTGSALYYSTYLGGSDWEAQSDIAIDSSGNVYITGQTMSTDFPMVSPPYQGSLLGKADAFVAKIGFVSEDPVVRVKPETMPHVTLGLNGVTTEVLTIYNDGIEDLTFDINTDAFWLTPDITSGTLAHGALQEVTLTYSAVGLGAGDYAADIIITSNDPVNPDVTVPASLTIDVIPPAAVDDLSAADVTFESVLLSWTAVADNGAVGDPASSYDIRYSTEVITELNWDNTIQVDGEPIPGEPGSAESFWVTGLNPSTPYYFAMKVSDGVGLISGLSNVATTATLGAPVLETDPVSITDTLMEGESSTHTLTLSNTGGDTLTFSVFVTETATPTSIAGVSSYRSEEPQVNISNLQGAEYVSDEFIVKFKSTVQEDMAFAIAAERVSKSSLSNLNNKYRVKKAIPLFRKRIGKTTSEAKKSFQAMIEKAKAKFPQRAKRAPENITTPDLSNIYVLKVEEGVDILEAIAEYSSDPNVEYAEPNYIYKVLGMPNDPKFDELWGLHNTGQTGGTADADIDAPEAWDFETGSNGIVVAVIDTGVDYTHEDLTANMWTNAGETNCANGVDDDGNGYIDDCRGWDFYNNDNDPYDDNGHGTHCAGTIGAVGDNGIGIAGVNWKVKIIPLKFLNPDGEGYSTDAIKAILYAIDMGASVMSNSWGGGGFSQSLKDAIQASNDAGILFVAGAGNGGWDNIGDDNDIIPFYPSSYEVPNVIAVAATDHNDDLASFSNYGAESVDVGAPGVGISSTLPPYAHLSASCNDDDGDGYGTCSGTSMATPHVSGVAALLKGYNPTLSALELKTIIMDSVDPIDDLAGRTVAGGRLNAVNALALAWPDWMYITGELSGEIQPGFFKELTVILDATGKATGNYEADITIVSNDPVNSVKVAPVILTVLPETGQLLTVNVIGDGTVISSPSGIDCPGDCSEQYTSGINVTLTATPQSGYQFDSWSGCDSTSGNTCYVTMDSNKNVIATFDLCSMCFTDVPSGHWAYDYIYAIYNVGITTGYGDGTYRPENTVTRAEMAAFIIRSLYGETFSYGGTSYFPDVSGAHWAFKYIQKMYEDGITTGYGDGTYMPENTVTRAEMAAFIIRSLYGETFSYSSFPYFPDVSNTHWAFKYIQKMYEDGITTGYGDGTFRPDNLVSRAEMAAFLARAFLGGAKNNNKNV